MLVFLGLACFGLAVIVAAFWDYRGLWEKKRARADWSRTTTTTMTGEKTGRVVIVYTREGR